MVRSLLLSLALSVSAVAVAGTAVDKSTEPKPTPLMRTVEPPEVLVGEVVTISGDHLSKDFVSAVYLTDGKKDRQLTLTAQNDKAVSFKVPADCKPALYKVVVLLNIAEPTLIEEPVRVNVVQEKTPPEPAEQPAAPAQPAPPAQK